MKTSTPQKSIILFIILLVSVLLNPACKSSELTKEERLAQKELARAERILEKEKLREAQSAPASSMEELLRRQPNVIVTGSGNSVKVEIRGSTSITSNNEPLYVLDGRRMGNNFQLISHINPGDVHRINIVRDPAELSAYGLGAAAGVIEIITIK